MKALTKGQVVEKLRKAQGNRTAMEFASVIGVSRAYLSDIYNARRDPGPAVLSFLGLQKQKKETAYAPQEQAQP